jgi:hypothetical protein
MQDLTQVIHALQHRIDQEHTYRKDLEYEVTILHRYVVRVRMLIDKAHLGHLIRSV